MYTSYVCGAPYAFNDISITYKKKKMFEIGECTKPENGLFAA
jgi:hypothetical protein